ncbi:MAG: RsmD family RNA methyltransferase, partial [Actinomycetes bacterium]
KGRRLVAPAGHDVRPTSSRVREAVFNSLGSLGLVVDATFLDLFAGTGALGIEALSRGAASVVFVDRAAASLAAVRSNLAACGLEGPARVVQSDALAAVVSVGAVDVALLDPPYDFDGWDQLLEAVACRVAVVESDRGVPAPAGASVLSSRRYGGTVVTMLRFDGRDGSGRTPAEVDK